MKRILIITALAIAALVPSTAIAAPAEQRCVAGATTQRDMAGTYRSSAMYVEIFPCGGIYVEWTNRYGTYGAAYTTEDHASDGVLATFESGTPFADQPYLAVKAAERGYVQVAVFDYGGNLVGDIYRLRKTS